MYHKNDHRISNWITLSKLNLDPLKIKMNEDLFICWSTDNQQWPVIYHPHLPLPLHKKLAKRMKEDGIVFPKTEIYNWIWWILYVSQKLRYREVRKFSYLTQGRKHLGKDNLFIPNLNFHDIINYSFQDIHYSKHRFHGTHSKVFNMFMVFIPTYSWYPFQTWKFMHQQFQKCMCIKKNGHKKWWQFKLVVFFHSEINSTYTCLPGCSSSSWLKSYPGQNCMFQR